MAPGPDVHTVDMRQMATAVLFSVITVRQRAINTRAGLSQLTSGLLNVNLRCDSRRAETVCRVSLHREKASIAHSWMVINSAGG